MVAAGEELTARAVSGRATSWAQQLPPFEGPARFREQYRAGKDLLAEAFEHWTASKERLGRNRRLAILLSWATTLIAAWTAVAAALTLPALVTAVSAGVVVFFSELDRRLKPQQTVGVLEFEMAEWVKLRDGVRRDLRSIPGLADEAVAGQKLEHALARHEAHRDNVLAAAALSRAAAAAGESDSNRGS